MISPSASLGEAPLARQPRRHLAALVHGAREEQALAPAVLEVLAAEGRGDVHDARAVVERDVVGSDDAARLSASVRCRQPSVGVEARKPPGPCPRDGRAARRRGPRVPRREASAGARRPRRAPRPPAPPRRSAARPRARTGRSRHHPSRRGRCCRAASRAWSSRPRGSRAAPRRPARCARAPPPSAGTSRRRWGRARPRGSPATIRGRSGSSRSAGSGARRDRT